MNILGAVTLEFIKHLKLGLKHWRVEPYAIVNDSSKHHSGSSIALHCPQSGSVIQYFQGLMLDKAHQFDNCAVLCRKPAAEPRLLVIKLYQPDPALFATPKFIPQSKTARAKARRQQRQIAAGDGTKPMCHITYFQAHGWRQEDPSNRYSKGRNFVEYNPEHLNFVTREFFHYSPPTTKRGLKTVYTPVIDLCDQDSFGRVAQVVAKVLQKSHDIKARYLRGTWWYGHMGVRLNGNNVGLLAHHNTVSTYTIGDHVTEYVG